MQSDVCACSGGGPYIAVLLDCGLYSGQESHDEGEGREVGDCEYLF